MKLYIPYSLFTVPLTLLSCTLSDPLIDELERDIALRPQYMKAKIERVESLKQVLDKTSNVAAQLEIYEQLYEEYVTFQFDSAMAVVTRQKELAQSVGNREYVNRADLHRIMLFATAGYYSELEVLLDSLHTNEYSPELKLEYYTTGEWVNNRLADYMNNDQYSKTYRKRGTDFQDSLIATLATESIDYYYWMGNRYWDDSDNDSLIAWFTYVYERVTPEQRRYAQATYDLSWLYARKGDKEHQREFMIRAAISDQRAQLKESLALQELALQLEQDGEEERANRYLSLAIEDALFYGNRLRLLQIGHKIPKVVDTYRSLLQTRGQTMQWLFIGTASLTLMLFVSLYFVRRGNRRLRASRATVRQMHAEQRHMNAELQKMNAQLKDTNACHEQYVSLFIDLCAAYIDKLDQYKLLVKRKITVGQTAELLKSVSSTRMTELEAKEFFLNFDTAFMTLYPTFIDELNALLRPGEEILPKKGEMLNPDLRIFALIRMGIRDSSKIATLLFYSPQTIYNRRTAVRNRAKDRDTFEQQVERLCAVQR